MKTPNREETKANLNLETGRINWTELTAHFARGVVIRVTAELDLVDVAFCFAEDNKVQVDKWLANGQISHASDEEAKEWTESNPLFWAIVSAPWVLVQPDNLQ